MAKKKLTDDEFKKAIIEASGDPDLKPENVILGPRRSELIEDGALVDVSALWDDEPVPMVKQVGFKIPVALTRAAWERHVEVPEGDVSGQCKKGRLWDVLFMAAFAAKRARNQDRLTFKLGSSANEDGKLGEPVETKLDLVIEGDDNLKPVMTISLHGED